MIKYSIEVDRDIEYRYFNHNDMFLVLKLSEMRFYDDKMYMIRKSEFSANSKTSLVFDLDDDTHDKSIGKIGEMDASQERAFKKCIEKINLAITNNRSVNEKLLHTTNVPFFRYEEFKILKLTRVFKFCCEICGHGNYISNIYISDDNNGIKTFYFDGSSEKRIALNDDEIIQECYNTFSQGKANDKKWNKNEIRKLLFYPTIDDLY